MSQTPYQWSLYLVLSLTLGFALFLMGSDTQAPFTTQAELHRSVANIAPEVSGNLIAVEVRNGQKVSAGSHLMTLDDRSYQLAVTQAQADLKQAQQDHLARQQELEVARLTLAQKRQQANNDQLRLERHQTLVKRGLVTQEQLDDSVNAATIADAAVAAAMAEVHRLQAQLSEQDGDAAILLAQAKLSKAELDLQRTRILSPTEGRVTNLQLSEGSYLSAGTPVIFLVDGQRPWVYADFNEKGGRYLQPGQAVWVVFDALPGHRFQGEIINRDQAVYDASSDTAGLADVTNDNRWIREQQKVRTRIRVADLDPALISGAKASVMVRRDDSLWGQVAGAWMDVIALFRYIY
ncbi:HlyD family secretion protein [Ferrimonas sp.]|uniref:HlyD family secretion protein n=1 Tax=Ferrimonas sp. TaxID=2080861 RepID=UPI003A8D7B70